MRLAAIFMLTVLACVSVVTYGVTHYTREAFEDIDGQRTEALLAQFQKLFAQRAEELVHQVENVAFDADSALEVEHQVEGGDQSVPRARFARGCPDAR